MSDQPLFFSFDPGEAALCGDSRPPSHLIGYDNEAVVSTIPSCLHLCPSPALRVTMRLVIGIDLWWDSQSYFQHKLA